MSKIINIEDYKLALKLKKLGDAMRKAVGKEEGE